MRWLKSSSTLFRLLAAGMIFVQIGCTMHPPAPNVHTRLKKQNIAYLPLTPEIPVDLDIFAKSRPEGAAREGGLLALGVFGETGGACIGPPEICGLVILASLAIGFLVGGTLGAAIAAPAERAKDMEATINEGVSAMAIHLKLPEKIIAAAKAYDWIKLELLDATLTDNSPEKIQAEWCRLNQEGYGFVLQTQISHLEFIGGAFFDPELMFHLGVKVTLVDLENLETVFDETFFHVSPKKKFSVWTSGDSKMIKDLLESNVTAVAQEIVDKLFIQTEMTISSGMWRLPGTKGYGCCWLCPVSPPYEVDYFPKAQLKYPVVASLTPLLEWEAVDEHFAKKGGVARGDQPDKVSYDLRVWEAFNDMRHGLIYERSGLTEAKHQLQTPLKPQRRYFWSFRACLSFEDHKSCTPWASSLVPSPPPALIEFEACSGVIHESNYYRFETPKW